MLPIYRFEEIRIVFLNRRKTKLFKVFKLSDRGYRFYGQFKAPLSAQNHEFERFIC
ncbi:hypothetical protein [Chromobacterium haemolyticum]|uniref:hypothetical protein n=1 Tax=Chromobacterium haemolyticum TaxID=394935 RepID=UPI0013199B10|nr:hypothetical protein [Chromobacterium haemolyticum]BBH12884.1 hypothetical protein CH06BL_21320 [Chromobacterium haemolyticum]